MGPGPGTQTVTRLADTMAGRASNIQVATLHLGDPDNPNQVGLLATPVRTDSGRLRVILWRLAEDGGSFTRLADSGNLGPENGVAAVRVSFQRIATAVRTDQGRLQVLVWRANNGGESIELLGRSDTPAEMAIASSELSIETMNAGQVVTVSRNGNGRLVVRNWGISIDGATVNPAGNGVEGEVVTEFATCRPFLGRLVTASRTAGGRLQLHSWATPPVVDPTFLFASDPEAAGDGRQISAVVAGDIMTAVRTLQGNLRLIRWNGALEREGDSGNLGGPASRTSVIALNGDFYVTAVRGENGRLQVDSWQVDPASSEIAQSAVTADQDQEPAGEVAAVRVGFLSITVTASQDATGRLKLIAWQIPAP